MAKELPKIWRPQRLDDWCRQVDGEPTPEWIIPDFLPTDAAAIMSGKSKVSQKTWMAFALSKAIASGEPVGMFEPMVSGPVLILEEEGPRKKTRKRWSMLENGLGIRDAGLPIYFEHRAGVLLDNPEWMERICSFVAQEKVIFVVLDTIAKMHRGDENSVQDISRASSIIDKIRKANPGKCSVMFLHHLRKEMPGEEVDIDDEMRGSSAWAGYYDVHFALRKRQPNMPHVELVVRGKDSDTRKYNVTWDINEDNLIADFKMAPVDPESIEPRTRDRCLEMMAPSECYSIKQLTDAWGIGREKTLRLLDGAVSSKEVVKSGRVYIRPGRPRT